MRFRPSDVAPNGDLIESASARPLLHGLDQAPSHAVCSLAFGYNQSTNLTDAIDHEELALRAVDPTDDFPIHLRDEFPPEKASDYCSPAGMEVMRKLAGELQARVA